jgi:hypothetical protein
MDYRRIMYPREIVVKIFIYLDCWSLACDWNTPNNNHEELGLCFVGQGSGAPLSII